MSPQFSFAPEMDKLFRLRAKTDNQVLDFIESKLQTASSFIALAETEFSEATRAAAQESLGLADRALGEAQTLLLIFDEQERRGLDRKLNHVTAALERVCRDRQLLRPLFLVARPASQARPAL